MDASSTAIEAVSLLAISVASLEKWRETFLAQASNLNDVAFQMSSTEEHWKLQVQASEVSFNRAVQKWNDVCECRFQTHDQ